MIPPESQVSTYAAVAGVDAAIIYGTKTGVELTSVGIPTIVAGEAWIRNKGLTLDASSPEDYFQILDTPAAGRADAAGAGRSAPASTPTTSSSGGWCRCRAWCRPRRSRRSRSRSTRIEDLLPGRQPGPGRHLRRHPDRLAVHLPGRAVRGPRCVAAWTACPEGRRDAPAETLTVAINAQVNPANPGGAESAIQGMLTHFAAPGQPRRALPGARDRAVRPGLPPAGGPRPGGARLAVRRRSRTRRSGP